MIRCPKCGERFNPQDGQAEYEWTEIIRLLPEFDGHSRLFFEYIELFSVVPLRMKGKKILRILKELIRLFEGEKFKYQKREYRISKAGIVEALQVVCNKQFASSLENHNYLKKVMIGVADRELKERRDARDKEQRRSEEQKVRRSDIDGIEEGEVITAEEYKKKRGIESLVESIGREMK